MNAVISETIKGAKLGLGIKIWEIPAQRKSISSVFHVHFIAHKPLINLKKIVNVADISETIKDIELGFQI